MNAKDMIQKLGDVANENLPHILTTVASIGVVKTSIETAKAVLKVKEIDADESDDRTASEKSKSIIKAFAPAIITGVLTIGCIVSSDVVHTKRYGSLLGAYIAAKSEAPKLKSKLTEIVGKEKVTEIEEQVKSEKETGRSRTMALPVVKRYKVVDLVTGHTFVASQMALVKAEMEVAKEIARSSHCDLEYFYNCATSECDAPEVANRIYWDQDERYDAMNLVIDSALDEDGTPYLTIDYEYNTR